MEIFESYSFSGEAIVKALSWTLLHSLWQGILLSFVAGLIMLLTKKAKPTLRYNLLVISIVLFMVSVFVTFIYQLEPNAIIVESNLVQTLPINRIEFSENLVMNTVQPSAIIQAIHFINSNAIWIVSIWLLVIVIKFIRLSSGFYNIYQLKHKQVYAPTEYWNKRITELCKQLKINKKVVLLQSGIVTIPSVIGYFKPIILFPAAMLTALPVHEVEAILIHELGHIRRNDFVVNMLQNIVEVVFFFNPAVMWVSSLIKTERENCCDDIAVSFTGNKKDYIKALINFLQFEQHETQQFATAFSGEKNHLLNRAKRIIYNNSNTLNIMEKKFLSASLVLVSVCLFAFVSIKAEDKQAENKTIEKPIRSTETRKEKLVFGKQDTKPVNKSEVPQAKPTADTVGKDAEQHNPQDENVYKFTNRTGIHFGDDYLTAYFNEKQISKIDRKKSKEEIEGWLKKYAPLTGVDLNAIDNSYYAKPSSPTQLTQRTASIQPTQHLGLTVPTATTAATAPTAVTAIKPTNRIAHPVEHAAIEDHSSRKMDEIIDELIANKIVKSRKEIYSIKFNADELVVNDIKQPTDLHKKFKNKYETSSTWSWGITRNNEESALPTHAKPTNKVAKPVGQADGFGFGHLDKTNPTTKIHTTKGGKEYDIIIKNEIVTELFVNSKRIDDNKIIDYKHIVDKILEEVRINKEKSKKNQERARKTEEESENLDQSLIQDLVNENIVKNKNDIQSYKLTSKELIVNNQKQPSEIHQKFKEKYVKSKGWASTMEKN